MAIGRPVQTVTLESKEREALERWMRRPTTAQALALRARIVLGCAEGKSNTAIAEEFGITRPTVGKWRRRFLDLGIDGLLDEPRPGVPRKVTDAQVEELLTRTLETMPKNATHWSTRSMAQKSGLSQSTVGRIWRAFGLQPHRTETFKLSKDPLFIEKTRDIVGLYMNPPEHALVLCVDEKTQAQALDRSQPLLPMRPGQVERRTHDYVRHGTTSLFAALDVATGEVIGQCHRQHRSVELRSFFNRVDAVIPATEEEIHVILDNSSTHKTALMREWFAAHPRYHLHFTPTSASWLNLVERFFAEITNKRIRRGAFRSTRELEEAIDLYLKHHNENPKPFSWTKSADEILATIARFCKRTSDSGH
jgi:transposase